MLIWFSLDNGCRWYTVHFSHCPSTNIRWNFLHDEIILKCVFNKTFPNLGLLSLIRNYYLRAVWLCLCSHGSSCVVVFDSGYHCRLLIEDRRVRVALLVLCFLVIGYLRLFWRSLSWVCFTHKFLVRGLFHKHIKNFIGTSKSLEFIVALNRVSYLLG